MENENMGQVETLTDSEMERVMGGIIGTSPIKPFALGELVGVIPTVPMSPY